ncbi:hypothetical protein KDA_06840 [Dictyobacter alpinus]|uniref:Uncharacterized protein n=1 Tax=Dictyobacter alpinus TaxID=2014873 RepID=A0A402B1F9_9CHLR|nr:hypothetical protein KDA_06840 [Dictyobacter alpinus]
MQKNNMHADELDKENQARVIPGTGQCTKSSPNTGPSYVCLQPAMSLEPTCRLISAKKSIPLTHRGK